ncbi:copper-binding protein [Nitrosovibrio tenuis]|uniref:Cu(I)/Ag(I) efflux system protein CusF n=1 Tax=Nitrosovibrio tenuis TaxID=1233 RepID=A0A1H7IVZ9_9PROT|nr:copper-binding protein [Nitrosovibrio tenuis]SEK66566.1 Cu(I)/Ag(I) efflux system protein CusF [Nitrosovibrio tenuis]
MKFIPTLALILAFSASGLATAQTAGMSDEPGAGSKATTHKTIAVVKGVDTANGKVKLAHEPVKSLNWPAMTMNFSVKDPALFDKLVVGKKVEVEFVQQGSTSVITAVR